MLTVLIALFAVALVAPLIFRWTERNGFYVLAAVPAAGFVWLLFQLPAVIEAQHRVNSGAAPPDSAAHPNAYPAFSAGSTVMALYPDTSCFYRAEVIESPRDIAASNRVRLPDLL